MIPAFEIVAKIATSCAAGDPIRQFATREGFASEQAHWTLAADCAGLMNADEVGAAVNQLSPRVADELDPDCVHLARQPLLMALAHAGSTNQLVQRCLDWGVSQPSLYRDLLEYDTFRGAAHLPTDTAFDAFGDADTASNGSAAGWWPRHANQSTQAEFSGAVRSLIAHRHWASIPGSLADLSKRTETELR